MASPIEHDEWMTSITGVSIESLGPDPTPPAVSMTAVRVGQSSGWEYRLADEALSASRSALTDEGFYPAMVRSIGERVTIRTDGLEDLAPIHLTRAQLEQLASLCRAWRRERVQIGVYLGSGQSCGSFSAMGRSHHSPLHYCAPGSWKIEQPAIGSRRSEALRQFAEETKVRSPRRGTRFAGRRVLHELVSARGELLAAVVRGPGKTCAFLTRGRLVLSASWPVKVVDYVDLGDLFIHGGSHDDDHGIRHLRNGAIVLDPVLAHVVESSAMKRR